MDSCIVIKESRAGHLGRATPSKIFLITPSPPYLRLPEKQE